MNFDIHTTHRLLNLIENAKEYNETLIDEMPLLLMILNNQKAIVRANMGFCSHIKKSEEELLSLNIENALDPISLIELDRVINEKKEREYLSLVDFDGNEISVKWKISAFKTQSEEWLYWVIGNPLAGDNESRERFEQLMQNLPYGLLRVSSDGLCTREFSRQLIEILGRGPLLGESLKDYFGSRILKTTKQIEVGADSVTVKLRPYGSENSIWCKWSLKRDTTYPDGASFYFSIFKVDYNGNKTIKKTEANNVNVDLLERAYSEAAEIIHNLSADKERNHILALLHSLKSCGRILGENKWVELILLAEEECLNSQNLSGVLSRLLNAWEKIQIKLLVEFPDFKLVKKKIDVFSRQLNLIKKGGTKAYSLKVWSEIETEHSIDLNSVVDSAVLFFENEKSKSKIDLTVDVENSALFIPEEYKGPIDQLISNLISNSVRFGFHSPLRREFYGKRSIGKIKLRFKETNEGIQISYSDDGEGIQYEKIRSTLAPKNEMIDLLSKKELLDKLSHSLERSENLDHEEVKAIQQIYLVANILGAEVEIESSWIGSKFDVFIPMSENRNWNPTWYSSQHLQDDVLDDLFKYLNNENWKTASEKITVKSPEVEFFHMLIDPSLVVFVLGECCLLIGEERLESLNVVIENKCLKFVLLGDLSGFSFSPYKRYLISKMLHLNKGDLMQIENGIVISFSDTLVG